MSVDLPSISETQWQSRAATHRTEVTKWTQPHRDRRGTHHKHPVYDFLFTYYPFSLGKLEQWHPGYGTSMEFAGEAPPTIYQTKFYHTSGNKVSLDVSKLQEKELKRISWMHNLLVNTQSRPANFACFGMHEWAMVYKTDKDSIDLRHRESAPLRLSQEETDRIIESRPICCTHFDAFRFFTPPAVAFNKLQPTLDERHDFEQPGCLHTNMDLYKWAAKCMPWVGSDLLWECFQLAIKTREIDMRASPYDLTQYGYSPIKIETAEGRNEYEAIQRNISEAAKPLRQRLIDTLQQIIS